MGLTADNVSWSAGGRLIVGGVSISAMPGRMLGLIGPNGSGKSSLLRLLAGLRKPAGGVVRLGETDLTTMGRGEIARRIAFVDQQVETQASVTVRDVVRLGRTPHRGALAAWSAADEAAVTDALRQADLSGKADRFWHTLSGGERQRAQIARALAQTPTDLLLDEPTNHLDIRHQLDILGLVARLQVTSIVALHDLNLAAMFCDTLVALREGRVVCAGPPEEVLTAGTIRDVFGVAARVERRSPPGRSLRIDFFDADDAR